jgi:hypothetical protein
MRICIRLAFVIACCIFYNLPPVIHGELTDEPVVAGDSTSSHENVKESGTTSEVLSEPNTNSHDMSGSSLSTEDVLDLDDLTDISNIRKVEESVENDVSTEQSSCLSEQNEEGAEEGTIEKTTTDTDTKETFSNATTVLEEENTKEDIDGPPVQMGPFIDLLGETLLSLEMVDERRARLHELYTNEALSGKTVVGLYFSADW